jgi:2-oxoacid:acceptor oxidoreductase gamma subunit (pyruvate/2-ketoisovalerate family)
MADIVVVLDDNLLQMVNVTSTLKPGGILIINSSKTPAQLGLDASFTVAVSDAFKSSEEAGLVVEGNVLISTSILGPIAAASDLVSIDNIKKAVEHKFKGKALEKNLLALELAYKLTQITVCVPMTKTASA